MNKISFHNKMMLMLGIHFCILFYSVITYWQLDLFLICLGISRLLGMIGNEVAMHRLWTHKSFTTSRWMEFVLHVISISLMHGSSITYAGVHRQHHAYADTEKDPHIKPWYKTFFYVRNKKYQIENKFIIDLLKDPWHKWTHKNYFIINSILLLFFLICFGPIITGYTLSLMIILNFIITGLVNTMGHSKFLGFRKFDTKDDSSNNHLLHLITWDHGLHNNHHNDPSSWTFSKNKWEIDIPAYIVYFIKNDLKPR